VYAISPCHGGNVYHGNHAAYSNEPPSLLATLGKSTISFHEFSEMILQHEYASQPNIDWELRYKPPQPPSLLLPLRNRHWNRSVTPRNVSSASQLTSPLLKKVSRIHIPKVPKSLNTRVRHHLPIVLGSSLDSVGQSSYQLIEDHMQLALFFLRSK
jgi:hypothetical protein